MILFAAGVWCGFWAAVWYQAWLDSLYQPREWTPQQKEAMQRLREEHLRGTR